jgi:hypothetical protein
VPPLFGTDEFDLAVDSSRPWQAKLGLGTGLIVGGAAFEVIAVVGEVASEGLLTPLNAATIAAGVGDIAAGQTMVSEACAP